MVSLDRLVGSKIRIFNKNKYLKELQNGWDNVRNMYNNDGDVDLYVGLLLEQPMQNAQVGPTAGCIIVDQFLALRGNFNQKFFLEYFKTVTNSTTKSKASSQATS